MVRSRPAKHWCALIIYGQPVIQRGSESCALIIGEDLRQKNVIDALSRLEEYFLHTLGQHLVT